ncbi:MAG: lytic transglycosylase domain-containing protein [Rhodobacteraceae bacterium]|nr:lytic transglycosylase domain-containing protein [Paracoccaceae bacterium]
MFLRILVATALSAVIGLASLPAPASAEGLVLSTSGKKKSRFADFAAKTAVLDSRAAVQYANSVRLTPHYQDAAAGADGPIPRYAGSYRGEFLEAARAAARKYGIPEDLFLRLVQRESGWNPGAVSVKGATGLAQLMPGTASLLGVDATDPHQNLDGGARYLRMMYDRFGTWRLALAAYNAGPLAVDEHDGIPPYDETQAYVVAILGG